MRPNYAMILVNTATKKNKKPSVRISNPSISNGY